MNIRTGIILGMFLLATACGGDNRNNNNTEDEKEVIPPVADWVWEARIGGTDLYHEMTDEELDAILLERKAQHVSVLEFDSRLSQYLSDEEFDSEVAFLDKAAQRAHDLGMKAMIYYPALEVLTDNADQRNSMFKDHPEWIQRGISGEPNVFVGNLEHWVEEGTESAWMSPNTGYKEYFLERIRKLANTALDGVWVDVPVYMETGTEWAGAEPAAAADFNAWTKAQGIGGPDGYEVPLAVDFSDPAFRAWIRWRHVNLANFVDDIRIAAQEVDEEFIVAIETFPVDNLDAMAAGLDGTYRNNRRNFLRVWEIDSVSNTQAMKWSTFEDFNSKITMNKFARACERENPAWVFSYGNEPEDAGLTIAAAVATGVAPFESKTPEMTLSVGTEFRTRWFAFIEEHAKTLFRVPRYAQAAVWYSGPTRDFIDYPEGGNWGMYITIDNPNNDPDWWAEDYYDGAIPKPHLGGYRGAAHALIQMGIPFKIVTDPGAPENELKNVPFLWLPSVVAMSDNSAAIVRNYVKDGGVVFASGLLPGTLDENGGTRPQSALADVFGFSNSSQARAQTYGKGVAIYRPDVAGADMFALAVDYDAAADAVSAIEQIIRIHLKDTVRFSSEPGIFVEVGRESETKHHLYVVNYTGLQQPLVSSIKNLQLHYQAPDGFRIQSATIHTPDVAGQSGPAQVETLAEGEQVIDVLIDQFAIVTLDLEPATKSIVGTYAGPTFPNATWKQAAEAGLGFIRTKMRDAAAPPPWSYGVYTNLIDDDSITEIYAHGHHVTGEHMGLTLRVAACMNDRTTYQESFAYVQNLMHSPVYSVVNWAMDKDAMRPLVEPDYYSPQWLNANAPLDDLRVVRGLLAGPRQGGVANADQLADSILRGLYWTSVTDRDRDDIIDFPNYIGGVFGFAWDWAETDDASLSPPATSTGIGRLTSDLIPVDYSDLYTIGLAARRDSRWRSVLDAASDLLLDAEISGQPGLFYNGLEETGVWTGDFENQGLAQGEHLKTIQILWIALHLARAATMADLIDAPKRAEMRAAAQRSLQFFQTFYTNNNRVPEYLTMDGKDVPDCVGGAPSNCLVRGETNLFGGEARIYAQIGRLALWLDSPAYAAQMINEKILPDRISNPNDPRYGLIGNSTAADDDAEAWNVLESILTICQAAGGE